MKQNQRGNIKSGYHTSSDQSILENSPSTNSTNITKENLSSQLNGRSESVQFVIDCSELDSSRQKACDSYLSKTRDISYPALRNLTNTDLSVCHSTINYKITKKSDDLAGDSNWMNNITYSAENSINSQPYDALELLHSINQCNGALDKHIFHGSMLTALSRRLNESTVSVYKSEVELEDDLRRLLAGSAMASQSLRAEYCNGLLAGLVTKVYFLKGESALVNLYQNTILPKGNIYPDFVVPPEYELYVGYFNKREIVQIVTLRQLLENELGSDYVSSALIACR